MTNYAAWDAFDVDRAIEEVDELKTVKDFASSTSENILSNSATDSLEITVNATRRLADALRSKAAVAALKNKRQGTKKDYSSTITCTALADTAVQLSLELSKAMEGVTKELSSLLEKVDFLKISIANSTNNSYARSDLRHGFYALQDIAKLMRIRDVIDGIVGRIRLFNMKVEILGTPPTPPSSSQNGVFDLDGSGPYDFSALSTQNNPPKDINDMIDTNSALNKPPSDSHMKGEPLVISSTLNTLDIVDESLKYIRLFASRYVSIVAINLKEYSISCDMSRYHLKLVEISTNKYDETVQTIHTGDGRRIKYDNSALDAIVWVARGLAFAGIGCAYLANIHFRRAKQLAPTYPHIDSVLEYLDGHELVHAQMMRTTSMETAIGQELSKIDRNINQELSYHESAIINLNGGITVPQMKRILSEIGESFIGDNIWNNNGHKNSKHPFDLHMEEKDEIEGENEHKSGKQVLLCGVCVCDSETIEKKTVEDFNIPEILLKISESSTKLKLESKLVGEDKDEKGNPFEILLSQNVFLCIARKIFYEGQILFLERLLYSAEIKYLVAYLLASAAIKRCEKDLKKEKGEEGLGLGGAVGIAGNEGVRNKEEEDIELKEMEEVGGDPLWRDRASVASIDDIERNDYCLRLQSACLANAALCRSHRSLNKVEKHEKKGVKQGKESKEGIESSDDNNQKQGIENQINCKILSNMSSLDLLDSSFCISDNIALLARKVCVLEKLRKFDGALVALKKLKIFVGKIPFNCFTADSGLSLESKGEIFSSHFIQSFEFFDFSAQEYSQKNLFSDVILPISVNNRVEKSTNKDSDVINSISSNIDNEDLYYQVQQQIQEKMNRLQHLHKRFG